MTAQFLFSFHFFPAFVPFWGGGVSSSVTLRLSRIECACDFVFFVFLQSPLIKSLPASDTLDEYALSTFFRSARSECLNSACCSLALAALRLLLPPLFFPFLAESELRLKAFSSDKQLSYVSSNAETLSPKPILAC